MIRNAKRQTRTVLDLLDPPCPEEATRRARPGFDLNSRTFEKLITLFDAFTGQSKSVPQERDRRRLKRLFCTCNEPVRSIRAEAISCATVLKWIRDANDWHPVVRFELCRALGLAHRLHGRYEYQNFFPDGDRKAVLKVCQDGIVAVHFQEEPSRCLSFDLHYPIEKNTTEPANFNDPYYYWDEWATIGIEENLEAPLPLASYLPEEHATPRPRYWWGGKPNAHRDTFQMRRLTARRLPDGTVCFSFALNPAHDHEPRPYRVRGTSLQKIERVHPKEPSRQYYRTFVSPRRPLVSIPTEKGTTFLRTPAGDFKEQESPKSYFRRLSEVALDVGWSPDQLANPRWLLAALRRERLSDQFVLVDYESYVESWVREFIRVPRPAEVRAELRRLHREISAAASASGDDGLEQPTHGMLRAALRRNHDRVIRLP